MPEQAADGKPVRGVGRVTLRRHETVTARRYRWAVLLPEPAMNRLTLAAVLILLAQPVLAADVLTKGSIAWSGCAAGYPADIRFEKHKKPGRVEVVHDGEGGSVDLAADGETIGADNLAGKEGGAKTLRVTGSIRKGTVARGACTGSYTAN
jgi:hypothetical protein